MASKNNAIWQKPETVRCKSGKGENIMVNRLLKYALFHVHIFGPALLTTLFKEEQLCAT
jgi:hypothetical protein